MHSSMSTTNHFDRAVIDGIIVPRSAMTSVRYLPKRSCLTQHKSLDISRAHVDHRNMPRGGMTRLMDFVRIGGPALKLWACKSHRIYLANNEAGSYKHIGCNDI